MVYPKIGPTIYFQLCMNNKLDSLIDSMKDQTNKTKNKDR